MSFLTFVIAAIGIILYVFGRKGARNVIQMPEIKSDEEVVEPTPLTPFKATVPIVADEVVDEINEPITAHKRLDFDVKKAIIYNAILEPKFKEFE